VIVAGEFVALLVMVTLPLALPAVVGSNTTEKEVLCPAFSVRGRPRPVTEKPVPVTLSLESETLPLPVFVSVTVCVELVPVVTLPKLSEVGEATTWSVCATPVPDRAMVADGVVELFTSVSEPVTAPAAEGAKLTVKVDVPPAAIVKGVERPESPKPVPVNAALLIVRLADPGFEIVTVCVLVTPVVTLPKLTEAGVTEICDCTPVPLNAMVAGELLALLVTVTPPLKLPLAVGANATLKEVDWPALSVMGDSPLTVNPVPVTLSFDSDTLPVPVFVRVTVFVVLVPAATLPKLNEVGEAESWRVCAAVPVPERATLTDGVAELFTNVSVPAKVPVVVGAKLTVSAEEDPAGMVSGRAVGGSLKPVPDTETDEMVRLAVPEFEIVTVWLLVCPVFRLPKLTDAGDMEICDWTPVPLKAMVAGELLALLITETAPLKLPLAVGANATLNEVDCPALSVMGDSPLTVKPLPVTLSFDSETLPVPVFANVTVFVVLVPAAILPKLNELGEAESWRVCAAAPVPERATLTDGVAELFTNVSVPAKVPVLVGAKLTVSAEEDPAGMVSGSVEGGSLKPVPDTETDEMVKLAVPEFEIVTVWLLVFPVVMLPKFTEAGETDNCDSTPLPLSGIVVGEFVALLVIFRLPLMLPGWAGVKETGSDKLWPDESVADPEKPLTEKPVPLAVTWETVTFSLPVLVTETDWVMVLPTAAEPKERVLGLGESCEPPWPPPEATPVPVTTMVSPPR
jgi:hypothetical protein